jgi:hypothetical protein
MPPSYEERVIGRSTKRGDINNFLFWKVSSYRAIDLKVNILPANLGLVVPPYCALILSGCVRYFENKVFQSMPVLF